MHPLVLLNPPAGYLENPPKTRRKARRTNKRARRHYGASKRSRRLAALKGWRRRHHSRLRNPRRVAVKHSRKVSRKRNKATGRWLSSVTFRGHKLSRQAWRRSGYRRNPKRRGHSRRRRNPSLGGNVSTVFGSVPSVLPFAIPGSGFLAKFANSMVQAAGAGAMFFSGYFSSGAVTDMIANRDQAASWAAASDWRGKWLRPLVFAAISGATGAVVAAIAKRLNFKNIPTIAALAAAGPGVRAFGGFLAAVMPQGVADTGVLADIKRGAVSISDYITVGDYITGGGGVSDYIRTLPAPSMQGVGTLVAANRWGNSAGERLNGLSPQDMNSNGL